MHIIFSTNYYHVKIVITMLIIARVFAEGLKIKCCLMMLSVSFVLYPSGTQVDLGWEYAKCPNNMLVSWWCGNCCWLKGGKLIFVKPWSTIFGVCESWCAVLRIVMEVHFVKSELPKSSIVNMYIEDQLKTLNNIIVTYLANWP